MIKIFVCSGSHHSFFSVNSSKIKFDFLPHGKFLPKIFHAWPAVIPFQIFGYVLDSKRNLANERDLAELKNDWM